jgi:hypothetical protein
MPHTNRRSRPSPSSPPASSTSTTSTAAAPPKPLPNPPSKRALHTTSDGWTHVVSSSSSSSKTSSSKNRSATSSRTPLHYPPKYLSLSLAEIEREYSGYKKTWESSDACATLRRILQDRTARGLAISNVVCLGLGSLCAASQVWRRVSGIQLAALESMIAVLQSVPSPSSSSSQPCGGNDVDDDGDVESQSRPCSGSDATEREDESATETLSPQQQRQRKRQRKLQVILQDPMFTPRDAEFFATRGWEVVSDPAAFEHLTSETLVFAVHCEREIYGQIPAFGVLVGNGTRGRSHWDPTREDGGKGIAGLLDKSEEVTFPGWENVFSDTVLYIPVPAEAPASSSSSSPSDDDSTN